MQKRSLATGLVLLVSVLAGCGASASEDARAEAVGSSASAVTADARGGNRTLVAQAMDALFVDFDVSAVDRYFAEPFVDHDAAFQSGLEPLRAAVRQLAKTPGFKYERVRVLADGDMAAVHGRYAGTDGAQVAFDVFRIQSGKIVEHWDALQAETAPNPSHRTELDGTTQVRHGGDAEANRTLVRGILDTVFIGGDVTQLSCFISSKTYIQHNPFIADGLASLVDAVGGPTATHVDFGYTKIHHLIADGDFVLAMGEGQGGASTTVLVYDLWRAEGDQLVEHWDVSQEVPKTSPSGVSAF
jgi:predicted SnoaL-like aldol condensation-catalyzing enzyme